MSDEESNKNESKVKKTSDVALDERETTKEKKKSEVRESIKSAKSVKSA